MTFGVVSDSQSGEMHRGVPEDVEGAWGGGSLRALQSQTVITSRSRRKWEKRISGVARLGLEVEVAPGEPLGLHLCARVGAEVLCPRRPGTAGPWALSSAGLG